jgi:septal ring factor EnvC (AmiA/AmiB activator)
LYISDVEILGTSSAGSSTARTILLRRVRLRRDAHGEIVRCEVDSILADLPQGIEPHEDIEAIKQEANSLRELLAERDRQLAEWHTCHETVERELKRASDGAAALQTKINATSNELARTRADFNKARAEADAHRKANEALNRQLQEILTTQKRNPSPVSPKTKPAAHRKPGDKPPGELAA